MVLTEQDIEINNKALMLWAFENGPICAIEFCEQVANMNERFERTFKVRLED